MKTWRHDELQEDLAAHLRGTRDRVIWTNMQMGPSGSPRPDVFTIAKSFARFAPLAYEIKVSVADFRRDVVAGKWQSYLKCAAGIIFAAPQGMICKADVPPGCGLIVRTENGWHSLKGPTLKHLDTLPREIWLKLIIDGIERQARPIEPRDLNHYRVQDQIRKRYGDELGQALTNRDAALSALRLAEKHARGAAKEADDLHTQMIRAASDRAKRDSREAENAISEARRELATILGLPADTPVFDLTSAAHKAAKRLREDAELQRLREQMERAMTALAAAREPLPFEVQA